MDESSLTELRALRARAYGRDDASALDAAEIARLHELERARRAETVDVAGAVPIPLDRPPLPEVPAHVAARVRDDRGRPRSEAQAAAGADHTTRPATPRAVRGVWMLAWAASILVVALAVGGTVFALASIRPVSAATGAVQVETLDEPGDPSLVRMWTGGSLDDVVVYEFAGLVVARLPADMFGQSTGGPCFLVADEAGFGDDGQSYSGNSYYGCGAGGFPATIQFVVDGTAPAPLRERFPDGTPLQFVLGDDGVGVFVGVVPSPSPAPPA